MAWGRMLLVWGVGWAIGKLVLPTAYPFFLALLIAFSLNPVVSFLERKGFSRALASCVGVFGCLGATAVALAVLLGTMWREAQGLLVQLPYYYRAFEAAFVGWGLSVGLLGPGKVPATFLQGPIRSGFQMASGLLGGLAHGAVAVPEIVLECGLSVLAAFFLSRDGRKIEQFVGEHMAFGGLGQVRRVGGLAVASTLGYLKAQCLLLLTTATVVSLGLWLIGSRYALILGLAAGMLDIVPLFGPATILLPWAAYLMVTGHLMLGLRLLALAAAVVLIREVVEMKVVGVQVGLHPLVALLAMYFGVKVFGGLGIALGPIILATGWAAGRLPPGTARIKR